MNKPKNTMKVSFPSRGANEGLARMLIAAFVTEADPTVEELCDIKTAVSEAVTNCIVHAYPDRIGEIYIAAALSENNLLTVKVRDHGCGIADVEQAMEPLYTTGGSERAGLGFAVMQELMDEVRAIARNVLEETLEAGVTEWNQIKSNVKDDLSKYLYSKTKRKPMILPVIMNV